MCNHFRYTQININSIKFLFICIKSIDQKLRWKMLKELKTPSLHEATQFINKYSVSNEDVIDKKESKTGKETKNQQPAKSVKAKTKHGDVHPKKKSSTTNIAESRKGPSFEKSRPNLQPNRDLKMSDTRKSYSNLVEMPQNRAGRNAAGNQMYQSPVHPYETPRNILNRSNHPGLMEMPQIGSGRNVTDDQPYLTNVQPMNRPQLFVGKGANGNVQMTPQGNVGRNVARNQMPPYQRAICYFCGNDRHPSRGTEGSWRENCPARNAVCRDCRKIGHFSGMPACQFKPSEKVIIIQQS